MTEELVELGVLERMNRPAYEKLIEIYEENLLGRNIRRKDLTEDEFEALLRVEYEGCIIFENDPQAPNGDKAFIWESRFPGDPYYWNGSDWVHEEDDEEEED